MSGTSTPLAVLRTDLNNLAETAATLNTDQQLPAELADQWKTILNTLPDVLKREEA